MRATRPALDRVFDPARLAPLALGGRKVGRVGAAIQLVASTRACVAGPDGACLACDAPQGEPCRRRGL